MRMETQKLARRLIFSLSEGGNSHEYETKKGRACRNSFFMSSLVFVLKFSF